MFAEALGQHQLGADAVGARYEHRLPVATGRQGEQPPESADAGENLGPPRTGHERLDAFDEFVARVDVDAGVFVGKWFFAHFGVAYSERAI